MARYFAETGPDNTVLRVVVCDDPEWLTDNLGGTWVETADPYSDEPQEVAYCGPGWGHDPGWPQRFAPPFQPGREEPYRPDEVVFHDGRLWRALELTTREPARGRPEWADKPTLANQ